MVWCGVVLVNIVIVYIFILEYTPYRLNLYFIIHGHESKINFKPMIVVGISLAQNRTNEDQHQIRVGVGGLNLTKEHHRSTVMD